MEYTKAKVKEVYLTDVKVDTIFIEELMPYAPADFVKVYLFTLSYLQTNRLLTDKMICSQLNISDERIRDAWSYWESLGVIKRYYLPDNTKDDAFSFTVEFVNLKELLYMNQEDDQGNDLESVSQPEDIARMNGDNIKDISSKIMHSAEKKFGRTISSNEMHKILTLIKDDNIAPDVIEEAISYCAGIGKDSFNYIERVVQNWTARGIDTADKAKKHIEEFEARYVNYKVIMKELGFPRNPSAPEKKIIDSWFDELQFSMDKVIEACGKTVGISNPNIKYVDKVLHNWAAEAKAEKRDVNDRRPVSQSVLTKYYGALRTKAEKEAKKRLSEVYERLPEIRQIDKQINSVGVNLSKAIFSEQSALKRQKLQEEMETLTAKRAILLADNDYDKEYTDVKYICAKCNDTGVTHMGDQCDCREERIVEAEEWQAQNERRKK